MILIRKCDSFTAGKPRYAYYPEKRPFNAPWYDKDRQRAMRWRWYCDTHGVSGSGKTFEICSNRAELHYQKHHLGRLERTVIVNVY